MKDEFLRFPFQVLFRPFSSFWDLKYEQKGTLRVAFTIVFLTVLAFIMKRQLSGLLVNFNDLRYVSSLTDVFTVLFPFFLFCIANWSITTLMDGEGRFVEIIKATAFSLLPFVLIYIPMTFISQLMVEEETAFYYLMNTIAMVWFLWLLFIGIMTVHQYTVLKTVITLFLSLVTMMIIVFLGTLVISMLQQMYDFIYNVYRELLFRT